MCIPAAAFGAAGFAFDKKNQNQQVSHNKFVMDRSRILKAVAFIAFLSACFFSTADTGLFVYPSLSRYLLLEIGVAVLSVVLLSGMALGSRKLEMSKSGLFIAAWLLYIVVHGLATASFEVYRVVYLCLTLSSAVILSLLLKERWLTRTAMENALLAVGSIHVVFIVFQKLGVIASGSTYFTVTGCGENPTVAALYLVGCLPILADRMLKSGQKAVFGFFIAVAAICIMLLRCRTAYVGAAMAAAVFLYAKCKSFVLSQKARPLHLFVVGVSIMLVLTAAGTGLYAMKKDSADGRLLIWKLSAEMMAERPQGYGYGLFERNYNLRQAGYFANEVSETGEKANADFVFMPYNDFIEQGVEGGVVGMAFLAAFYFVMIRRSALAGDRRSAAVFCSFGVMSLLNFVYTSVSPWFLLMCHAAFIMAGEECLKPERRRAATCFAGATLLCVVALSSYKALELTAAQARLREIESEGRFVDDRLYAEIERHAGTSEAFWTRRARNSVAQERYADALRDISRARAYSSSPELFVMAYRCQMRFGRPGVAVGSLDTLSHMLPRKLTVKYMLMNHYAAAGNMAKALRYADEILAADVKVWSERTSLITNRAKLLKENYE